MEPVFIAGSGRSGSSLTHELLQQDPEHRAIWWWETRAPRQDMGESSEIVSSLAYLCSQQAGLIIGKWIEVDGGHHRAMF